MNIMSFKFKIALLLPVLSILCIGCSSSDNEPWDSSWDDGLTSDPPHDGGSTANPWEISPAGVVLFGEVLQLDANLEKTLRTEAARQASNTITARTTTFGQLRDVLGPKALEMDALIVDGPLDESDLVYIRHCATSAKLRHLDLSKATLQGNSLPAKLFVTTEYVYVHDDGFREYTASYVPIYTLVLPSTIEKIEPYALSNLLITRIELPASLKSLGTACFQRNIFLGGELNIERGIEQMADAPFYGAGDGTLVVNYSRPAIEGLSSMNISALNLTDGVVETIEPYAMEEIRGLEEIELPASMTKIGICAMRDIPSLKTIRCMFSNPAIVPCSTEDEIMSGALMAWGDPADKGTSPTPADAVVYVPAGCKDKFEQSLGWMWFNKFEEM